MTTFPELAEPVAPEDPSIGHRSPGRDHESSAAHSMQYLQQIAATLGIPVETFFDEGTRAGESAEASDRDIADLIDAFRAVRDPSMRRYCIDVVRAVGADRSRRPA